MAEPLALSWGQVVIGIAVAVGTIVGGYIGGFVYLVKLVIAPLVETVKVTADSVKELYESRNKHEIAIVEIQTVHKIKGCDQPGKKEV